MTSASTRRGSSLLKGDELAAARDWAASLRLGTTFTIAHRMLDTIDSLKEELTATLMGAVDLRRENDRLRAAVDAIRNPKCEGCGDMSGHPCACAWAAFRKALNP